MQSRGREMTDNLVRKLFSKATTKWSSRALLILLSPYLIFSHLRHGLSVAWGTLRDDLILGWKKYDK